MRINFRLLATGVLLLATMPATLRAQGLTSKDFPTDEKLAPFGLVRKWFVQVPLDGGREKVIGIKAHEDLVFVQTSEGLIHCLDSESGNRKWSATVSTVGTDVFPPAVTADAVYVTSGKTLRKLNRESGRMIVEKELSTSASAGPACNENYLFVPLANNYMEAMFLDDPFKRVATVLPVAWHYNAGAPINSPPVVLSDRVAITGADGKVFVSLLKKREMIFTFISKSAISAPLSALDGFLYLAAADASLYCIDLRHGGLKWRFVSGFPLLEKPLPFLEEIYVTGAEGGGLHCVSTKTGELKWPRIEQANRVISVSENRAYATDQHNNVLAISRKDGHIEGSWPAATFTVTTENQFNDRIFQSTPGGIVVCLHEKELVKPLMHAQKGLPEEEDDPKPKTGKNDPTKKKKGFFDSDDDGEVKPAKKPKKEVSDEEKPAPAEKPKKEKKDPPPKKERKDSSKNRKGKK